MKKPFPYFEEFSESKKNKSTKKLNESIDAFNEIYEGEIPVNHESLKKYFDLLTEKAQHTLGNYEFKLEKDHILVEALVLPSIYANDDKEATFNFNVDGMIFESHNSIGGLPLSNSKIDRFIYNDIIKVYESVKIYDRKVEQGKFKLSFKIVTK